MDDSLFEKMGKPKPGEWLCHFHERGQSFVPEAGQGKVAGNNSDPFQLLPGL